MPGYIYACEQVSIKVKGNSRIRSGNASRGERQVSLVESALRQNVTQGFIEALGKSKKKTIPRLSSLIKIDGLYVR